MITKTKSAAATIAAAAMLAGTVMAAAPALAAHGGGMGPRVGAMDQFSGHSRGGDDWWMRHGGRDHHHGNNWIGPAIGFGAGVALGSALAYPYYGAPYYGYGPSYAYNDSDSWCAARFRSYNPVTHTYTGYDGLQHACP